MSTLASASVVPLYAGFWRRAGAICIDGVVVFLATLVASQVLRDGLLLRAVAVLIACAYYAGCHSSSWQATIGKRIYGIKVTDESGGRISVLRAIARYFATWLSALILGIGFLMAGFSHRKQALHDMLCGTLVVNRLAQPREVVDGGGVMPVTGGIWIFLVLLVLSPFVAGLLSALWMPAYRDYTRGARMVDGSHVRVPPEAMPASNTSMNATATRTKLELSARMHHPPVREVCLTREQRGSTTRANSQ